MLSLPGNGRSVRKTGCALGLAPWQHRAAGTGKRWLLRAELLPYKRSHSSFTGALKISGNQRLPQNSICANQASQLSEVPRLKLFWSKEKTSLLSVLLSAVAVSGGDGAGRASSVGDMVGTGGAALSVGPAAARSPPQICFVASHCVWTLTVVGDRVPPNCQWGKYLPLLPPKSFPLTFMYSFWSLCLVRNQWWY